MSSLITCIPESKFMSDSLYKLSSNWTFLKVSLLNSAACFDTSLRISSTKFLLDLFWQEQNQKRHRRKMANWWLMMVAHNVRAWRWWGNLYSFARTSADKRTKVKNKYKSSSTNFQPGRPMNNEQKADEMNVSPRYRQAHCCAFVLLSSKAFTQFQVICQ